MPDARTVGRTTSAEARRGAEHFRRRPSKVGVDQVDMLKEALRAVQVASGDVVIRIGPRLRGTPQQTVVAEEAQTDRAEDPAEDPAEDLAAGRATEPVTDEGADKDHLGPEPETRGSSRSWKGYPNAWCPRRTPRDAEESTIGINSLESDASCPRLTWETRLRNS